jgi:hypothetical protein
VHFASPFFTLYFLRYLELSYGFVAVLATISACADLLGMQVWGRISDKVRNKAIIQFAGWVAVFLPLAWVTVRPGNYVMPLILHAVGGGFWAGINLCMNNLLLRISPQENKAFFLSVYNMVAGVGAALGPIMGGLAAKHLANFHLELVGLKLAPLQVVFLISTALRFLSFQLFKHVSEPKEATVGQLIRVLRNVRGLNVATGFNYLLHPFIDIILDDIIHDLNSGNPGVLCIREGDMGHAVVPWRVKQVGSNRYHVYIYDPNHPYESTHDSTEYTNFTRYPYIVFGISGWSRNGWWEYEWNSTSTWNGNIFYFSYDEAIGNPSSINYIGSLDPGTTPISDQRLPDPIQALAISSGDSTFYAEDSSGRKTGYMDGELVSNIPYSAPISEFAGDDAMIMFMLPSNTTLTYHMESSIDSENEMGEYSFMVWINNSCYLLENMSCTKDTKDEMTLTPRSQ